MSRLTRYLTQRFLVGYAVTTGAIAALLWLLRLMDYLEDVGAGRLNLLTALWHAALPVPETLVTMLPVIAILATASVLSLLQSHSEIVVIRAAGWSVHRLAQTALLPLAVAIGVAFVISQWLAPQLHQPGGPLFGQAVGDRGIWHERHGLWLLEDDRYLNVRELRLGQVPSDIHLFEFNDDGGLARYIQAREAAIDDQERWTLQDVVLRTFVEGADNRPVYTKNLAWDSLLNRDQLRLLQKPPNALSTTDLASYGHELHQRGQNVDGMDWVLWQRLTLPLACIGMVLIAIATAGTAGTTRSGTRAALGLGIGIAYMMLAELIGYAGLLAEVPAPALALFGPCLLLGIGLFGLHKSH